MTMAFMFREELVKVKCACGPQSERTCARAEKQRFYDSGM